MSSLDGLGGCYTNCVYIGESSNWSGYQTLTLSVGVQITSPLPVSPSAEYPNYIDGLGYTLTQNPHLMRSMFASRRRRIVSTSQDPSKTSKLAVIIKVQDYARQGAVSL